MERRTRKEGGRRREKGCAKKRETIDQLPILRCVYATSIFRPPASIYLDLSLARNVLA